MTNAPSHWCWKVDDWNVDDFIVDDWNDIYRQTVANGFAILRRLPRLAELGVSYLESKGLFTPCVKFSLNSVQSLLIYDYNLQAHSKVGMENLNLGHSEVKNEEWHDLLSCKLGRQFLKK